MDIKLNDFRGYIPLNDHPLSKDQITTSELQRRAEVARRYDPQSRNTEFNRGQGPIVERGRDNRGNIVMPYGWAKR